MSKIFKLHVILCFTYIISINYIISATSLYADTSDCSNLFKSSFPLSDIDTIDYYLDLYSSNHHLTNEEVLRLATALRDVSSIDQDSLDRIIDIIIDCIRVDTGIWGHPVKLKYRFLTSDNLVNILIPIIAKYQNRASILQKYLTIFFDRIDFLCDAIPLKIRHFLLRTNNLIKLQVQKQLISSLSKLKDQDQLIVALAILSNNAYLYLKNTKELISYKYLTLVLKDCLHNNESTYIQKLTKNILTKFSDTPSLPQLIISKSNLLQHKKLNTPELREEISILLSLYEEILSGRIPINLSNPDLIGVGCDILSASDSRHYLIEVKSRIVVNPRKITLSRNEAEIALHIYKNYPQGEYRIYIVNVTYSGKKLVLPTSYEVEIDWDSLDNLILTNSYEVLPKIPISRIGTIKEKK